MATMWVTLVTEVAVMLTVAGLAIKWVRQPAVSALDRPGELSG